MDAPLETGLAERVGNDVQLQRIDRISPTIKTSFIHFKDVRRFDATGQSLIAIKQHVGYTEGDATWVLKSLNAFRQTHHRMFYVETFPDRKQCPRRILLNCD